MPEDPWMGLLPPVTDVANTEEIMALLESVLSCHSLQLSLSGLVVVAIDTKWKGSGQSFKDCDVLEWMRLKLS